MTEERNKEAMDTARKADLKKKRLTVLLAVLGALVILLALNTIDFENAGVPDVSTTQYAPVTQPIQNFYEPDYESDITKDKTYMALDRTISYIYDGQTVVLEAGQDLPDGAFTAFFLTYFKALQAGFGGSDDPTAGFNALYSEVYYRTHHTFGEFAPQKVYDIEILRTSEIITVESVEQMADKPYIGALLATFEVRYKIYKNDGTFRRDISEEDVIPQIFTVMAEKNGNVSVNSVTYIRYDNPSDVEETPLLPLVMPIVWVVLAPVLSVLAIILKKKPLYLPAALSFVTFLLSTTAGLTAQFLFFFLTLALGLGALYLLKRKSVGADRS